MPSFVKKKKKNRYYVFVVPVFSFGFFVPKTVLKYVPVPTKHCEVTFQINGVRKFVMFRKLKKITVPGSSSGSELAKCTSS